VIFIGKNNSYTILYFCNKKFKNVKYVQKCMISY